MRVSSVFNTAAILIGCLSCIAGIGYGAQSIRKKNTARALTRDIEEKQLFMKQVIDRAIKDPSYDPVALAARDVARQAELSPSGIFAQIDAKDLQKQADQDADTCKVLFGLGVPAMLLGMYRKSC